MRKGSFAPGEFYHIYNRGTEKRTIFLTAADHDRFLALLYFSNGTKAVHLSNLLQKKNQGLTLPQLLGLPVDRGSPLVAIGAYCLMPNHFHLLVREETDGGVSRFMQKVMTGYTMYFNTRYERTGTLFEGTFKSQHADTDKYLKYLISYIHLNPVKLVEPKWKELGITNRKKVIAYLERYRYSSYADFRSNDRKEKIILTKDSLPDYFASPVDLEHSLTDWFDYADAYAWPNTNNNQG